ncbi:hypothetical protein J2785_003387 [Burkholderia ambifaria]|nr:hypothetical protein [Burkholderia ambifaria]
MPGNLDPVESAAALSPNVEARNFSQAQSRLQVTRLRRVVMIGRQRIDDQQIDILGAHACIGHRLFRGRVRQIHQMLARGQIASRHHAGPLANKRVACLDHRRDLMIVDDPLGQRITDPGDGEASGHARPPHSRYLFRHGR